MNKLLTASLPALALLALGGCTASRSVATTEDDGVYYSSRDHTTTIRQSAPASASASQTAPSENNGEATNPDYQAGSDTRRQAPNSPEYYDNGAGYSSSGYSDNSAFHRPYAGPTVGLAYYSPPVVFAPSYGYAYGAGACGYSPFGGGFCDPFYSPWYASPLYGYSPYDYYSPFAYGYGGSYFSLSFGYGYGRPYYGGYGRPYYGGYDPYYGGGYGRNYGYNNYGYGNSYGSYYGNRQVIRPNGSMSSGNGNTVLVGPRRGRGGDVLAGRDNAPAATPGTAPAGTPTGGRRHFDGGGVNSPNTTPASGVLAPTTTAASSPTGDNGTYGRRGRESNPGYQAPNSPTSISDRDQPTANGRYNDHSNGGRRGGFDNSPAPASTDPNTGGNTRGRWRNMEEGSSTSNAANGNQPGAGRGYEQPQVQPQNQPADQQGRRGGFFNTPPSNNGQNQNQADNSGNRNRGYEQPAPQPQPQRTYEQPQRTYERPQRTYEQPTYSQPQQQQRSYERPSYSQPSNGGGNSGGGGNNGGGGGGGRRGRF